MGLVELILVFGAVLAFAVFDLMKTRREIAQDKGEDKNRDKHKDERKGARD